MIVGEICKWRPVVVVSNEAANRGAGIVTVVPLTSQRIFPFEVLLDAAATGLGRNSKACAQQARMISKMRLADRRVGVVRPAAMRSLDAALRLHRELG